MFLNSNHLPQRLRREHFTSPEFLEREIETLFLPAWHPVAFTAQFPRIGDYQTFDLLGRPLILWRTETGYRAYLNVCAHRFSTLTSQPSGHAAECLKCQFHGWEYNQDGNTCKIPDAVSFRPLTKGQLGLKEYRVATAGQLIFVSLNDAPLPLEEFLGAELSSICEEWFGAGARLVSDRTLELPSNWKVPVEVGLESYHIEMVHPKTFGTAPTAETCTHEFFADYDHFTQTYPSSLGERLMGWLTGQVPDFKYHNMWRYPHFGFGKASQFAYVFAIWPRTVETCTSRLILFDLPGTGRGWRNRLAHRLLRFGGRLLGRRIQDEDASIAGPVQRGLSSADQPHGGGLISAREERVFAFQERILKAVGEIPLDAPLPFVDGQARSDAAPLVPPSASSV